MFTTLVLAATSATFLALRLYPIWPRRLMGCDAYYFLMNAEALRRQRRLPVRLPPVYMLEASEQWYPPGFAVLCAALPPRWLAKRYWLVNHLVDLGSAYAAYLGALAFGVDPLLAMAAALAYGIAPGLISEFSALNARPLGLLLFNSFLIAAYLGGDALVFLGIAALLSTALFFSHKLSTQLLWPLLPALAAMTGEWHWLLLLGAMYAIPFLLWPRGAWRIALGHHNIVRFWSRNWRLLGAHAVRQSPIFGDGRTRTDVYADESPAAYWRFAKQALHDNYYLLPVALAFLMGDLALDERGVFLATWIAVTYGWGTLVHLFKPLRGLGLGRQYFKYALVPTMVATVVALSNEPHWSVQVAALLALLLNVRQYVLISRLLRRETAGSVGRVTPELACLLSRLKHTHDIRLMVLPVHLCDLVAYETGQEVYWGTHSDAFDQRLENFFPVLRKPLPHYVQDGVTDLLLDTRYCSPSELQLSSDDLREQEGPFHVYRLKRAS